MVSCCPELPMKSIVRLCAAAAFVSLLAPAALADDGPYMRFAAGPSHMDENTFPFIEFDPGFTGSAALGYNWFFPQNLADVRVELEGSYRYNDVHEIASLTADGDAQVFSAMVNGYLDFRTTWPVVPYVGIGFGGSHIRYEDDGAGGLIGVTINDNDTIFAYQVMGGVFYNLSESMAIGFEYRFLETETFVLDDSAGGTFASRYNNHSGLFTLTVGF